MIDLGSTTAEDNLGQSAADATEATALGRIGRPAVILAVTIAAGQVFGVLRELFVAARIGTSPSLDAFLIAVVLPTMLFALFVGGTAIAMVPAYFSALEKRGEEDARRLIGTILTWAIVLAAAAAVMLVVFAPFAVAVTGPGLDEGHQLEAQSFIPILAPTVVFGSVAGLLVAVYQIHERFVPIAVAWLLGPIVSLVVTVGAWDSIGLNALAFATTLSSLAMCVVLLLEGFRTHALPPVSFRAPRAELIGFGRHAAPLWASSAILNLTLIGDRAVATILSPGAVSALRFGDAILRVPINTLGHAWTIVVYPTLVRATRPGATRSLGDETAANLRYLICAFMPLAVATAAMAPLIVDVVYRRGAFGDEAALETSRILAGFAPLLVLTMVNGILVNAHNARRAGALLLGVGILNVLLNITFDVVFGLTLGVGGIALSSSVTMTIITLVLAWRLQSEPDGFPMRAVLTVSGKALAASLVAGVPIAALVWTRAWEGPELPDIGVLLVLASIGLVVYLAFARVFRLMEPWIVIRAIVPFGRTSSP